MIQVRHDFIPSSSPLVAQAAGPAMPLSFAIGTVIIALVGLSFVAFSRKIAHAGSAYAYVRHAFGPRCGFIAGWLMLLSYLAFAGATCALVGNFLDAVVRSNFSLGMRSAGKSSEPLPGCSIVAVYWFVTSVFCTALMVSVS